MKHRIYLCKECGVKRWIFDLGTNNKYHKYSCSKGHTWSEEVLTAEKIVNIMQDVFKDNIGKLFDRDDTFYKSIKR